MKKLNLVVICLDTFRADLVGPGEKLSHVKTPNLDRLARESVVFKQAYGEAQPTLQMRRAFFTGCRSFPWRYNYDRRGVWHHAAGWHKIPPHQTTLAELLLEHGYYTGLVADTYHMFKPTLNFTRGFVTYEFIRGQESDNWRPGSISIVRDKLAKYTRDPDNPPPVLVQYLLNTMDRKSEEDYFCAQVFRKAAEWLELSVENQPFFLWIDSFDPHEPWDPPREYADAYYSPVDGIEYILGYPPPDATPEERERVKALYFGEVTLVDKWLGHFLEKMDELGLWDNTVLMVISDHGTELMDHGHIGKSPAELHPFNTRILWMIRYPDGPRGKTVEEFVQSHDLFPTALELLGIPCPQVDGESVWPLVTGEKERLRDHIVIGWAGWRIGPAGGRASVRTKEWNYVVTIDQPDKGELYHLPTDPEEKYNVVDQHPEVARKLRREVEALMGQPLPATLPELCDKALSPISIYLQKKRRLQEQELHDVP